MSNLVIELQSYSREEQAKSFAEELGIPLVSLMDSQSGKVKDPMEGAPRNTANQANGNYKNKSNHLDSSPQYRLVFAYEDVSLCDAAGTNVMVDFVEGESAYRRKHGGGKGQMLAKAVGLNKGYVPQIVDATAGLGGDAFVLACLGCRVHMIERSPVAHVLLEDGLRRAKEHADSSSDTELSQMLDRMSLVRMDSLELNSFHEAISDPCFQPEVIYLDPMFPERKKTAEVKKTMKAFHHLIGADDDSHALLEKARASAEYRVVVKRPRKSPFLDMQTPSFQLVGKSSRFDIYTNKAFPKS